MAGPADARRRGPLGNVTVVSIEQAVAAPFATRQLADLGARVIKIERPDGGDFARAYDATVKGLSSYFVWLNRSKESLTLDLKRPQARSVLDRLLAKADVFVQNLGPGATDRLDLAAAALRAAHPRLIVCSVTGYGSTGPFACRKAYDLLVQSEVGLLSITGTEDHPSKAGISIADIAAGMYAYSGILAALLSRHATNEGTAIEVSLFDALAEWMSAPAYYTAYGGAPPPRSGAHHASIAPYGVFLSRDGEHVYLAVQNPREWTRFCGDVLRRPELADDERFRTNPARVGSRKLLHDEIDRVFATLPAAEIIQRLESAGIAHARMNSIAAFLEHTQLTERKRWREIDSPAGALRALVPPVFMEHTTPVMNAVPALGEHSEAILEELGFDRRTVAAWRQEGAI